MITSHHISRQILKNYFFNKDQEMKKIPISTAQTSEDEENLHDYIESYQQVTRWK